MLKVREKSFYNNIASDFSINFLPSFQEHKYEQTAMI